MLKLGLSLSLSSLRGSGAWKPTDEGTIVGWWKHATGITDSGAPNYDVSKWDDQSDNNNQLVQATASEQPTNGTGANDGVITFNPSNTENMDMTSQISLSGDFTIGASLNVAAGGCVLLGDNTANGEFFRFFSTSKIRIRIDNTTAVDIDKDSGTFLGQAYMVLTRVSNVITLYWNGVAQADTETLSGTADIDNLGVRKTDTNPYDGTISELMIFSAANDTLTANVNDRLSSI